MGIEYYIQGYRNGEATGINLKPILDAFGKKEGDHTDGLYRLFYDEANDCNFQVTVENGIVTSICIFRPCAHQRLYRSIFDVLRAGPYVLYAPGSEAPVIAYPDISDNLPDGMIDALGEPVIVHCADDIPSALFG